MREGEKEMAKVTYTVTVAGGVPTITPGVDQVVFTKGDFLVFNPPVGAVGQIRVEVTGGPKMVVACADDGKVKIDPPLTLDADGNIIITFLDAGGNPGDSGFPP
jgi:hypothetical protein